MKMHSESDNGGRRDIPKLMDNIVLRILDIIAGLSVVGICLYCYIICTFYKV